MEGAEPDDMAFEDSNEDTSSSMRKDSHTNARVPEAITLMLGYQTPYRFDELLSFFRVRALEGVEIVDGASYARAARIDSPSGTVQGWMRITDDAKNSRLMVTMSESLAACAPQVSNRVRRMFDTDCDPAAVAKGLAALDDAVPGALREGTRLPGCFNPFETACRAVLGQQISVVAANRLAARIVDRYGMPVQTDVEGLSHVWPSPAEVLALDNIEDAFGELGVIKTRSRVIAEIARMTEAGELDFGREAAIEEQMERLQGIKGVGPWTANYIAMRAMSYPDAFLETDAGVKHALPDLTPKQRLELAEKWRPWRSYAVVSLWNSLGE
ncbi:MAG: hypothetical protein IJ087_22755 [Eggerthellaceae bacterium]|nr:hypothetical protein [Eggerthellaceae bacterium]